MSFFNLLYLVKKRLFRNKWLMLFGIVVSTLALTVFFYASIWTQTFFYGKQHFKECLKESATRVGFICNNQSTLENEQADRYAQILSELDEVEAVGFIRGYSLVFGENADVGGWWDIQKIQSKNNLAYAEEYEEGEYAVQMIDVNRTLLPCFNLLLESGERIEKCSDDAVYVYLGYNFRDIPIGTKIQKTIDGYDTIVAGILKKGSYMLDPKFVVFNSDEMSFRYTTLMDNMVLLCKPTESQYYQSKNLLFSCAPGYTFEKATAKIKETSEKLGIQADFETLQHRMDTLTQKEDWAKGYMRNTMILLGLASVVLLVVTQIFLMYRRREEIGIWVTAGIAKRTIVLILVVENLIKIGVAFGMALLLAWNIWKFKLSDAAYYMEIQSELFGRLFLFSLGIALVLTVLVSLLPVFYLYQRSLCALAKGDWEEKQRVPLLREGMILLGMTMASFVVAFAIIYFGLYLFQQEKRIEYEREQAYYEENFSYSCMIPKDMKSVQQLGMPEVAKGNVFLRLYTAVGKNKVFGNNVDILYQKKEGLKETITYEEDYLNGTKIEEPQCVIGEFYERDVYREEDRDYIDVYDIKCRVVGRFASASFAGEDSRFLLFGDSLSIEQYDRLLFEGEGNGLVLNYRKAFHDGPDELTRFHDWVFKVMSEEQSIWRQEQLYYHSSFDDAHFYEFYMPILKFATYGMLLVAAGICALVTFLWGSMHKYEMSVKRTLGYSYGKLLCETLARFYSYELTALALVCMVTLFYDLRMRKMSEWTDTIVGGFGTGAMILLLVGGLLAAIPFGIVIKQKPAEVLKNMD